MAKPNDKCIGLSKKSFKVGKVNSFVILAEDIAPASIPPAPPAVLPNVYLTSRSHIWSTTTVARKHDDAISVDVRCLKRKRSGVARAPATGDGVDDLTVTIVFDEGGGTEVVNECCFEDVTYDG